MDKQTRTLPLPPRHRHQTQQQQQHHQQQQQQQPYQQRYTPPPPVHHRNPGIESTPLPPYRGSTKPNAEQPANKQHYSRPPGHNASSAYLPLDNQSQKLSSANYRDNQNGVYDRLNNNNNNHNNHHSNKSSANSKPSAQSSSHRSTGYVDSRRVNTSHNLRDTRQYAQEPQHRQAEHVNQSTAGYGSRSSNDYYAVEHSTQQRPAPSSQRKTPLYDVPPSRHGHAPPPQGYEHEMSSSLPTTNKRSNGLGATSAFWNFNKMPQSVNHNIPNYSDNYANVYKSNNGPNNGPNNDPNNDPRNNPRNAANNGHINLSNNLPQDMTSSLYGKHSAPSTRCHNPPSNSQTSLSQFRGYIPPPRTSNQHCYVSSDISKPAQV